MMAMFIWTVRDCLDLAVLVILVIGITIWVMKEWLTDYFGHWHRNIKPKGMPISTGEIMRGMTLNITVTGLRQFKFRLWLAILLIRLGAWVAGVGKVDLTAHDEDEEGA